MTEEEKKLLRKKNKFILYANIKRLYNQYKTEDITTTVVLRKYIYPIYPISRTTLYEVLCTPVNAELKKIKEIEERNKANNS